MVKALADNRRETFSQFDKLEEAEIRLDIIRSIIRVTSETYFDIPYKDFMTKTEHCAEDMPNIFLQLDELTEQIHDAVHSAAGYIIKK